MNINVYFPEFFEMVESELKETEEKLRRESYIRLKNINYFNERYPKADVIDYVKKSSKLKRKKFTPSKDNPHENLDGLIGTLYDEHMRVQYIAKQYLLNGWIMPKYLRGYLASVLDGLSDPEIFKMYESNKKDATKDAIYRYIVFRVLLCGFLGQAQDSKDFNVFESICDEVKITHNYHKLNSASYIKQKYLENTHPGIPLSEFIDEYLNEFGLYRAYLKKTNDEVMLKKISDLFASLHINHQSRQTTLPAATLAGIICQD